MTIHGSLQAERLGHYFANTPLIFTHIFSSDLQRAVKTAETICHAQRKKNGSSGLPTVDQLPLLKEQDFGYYEGKSFHARTRNSTKSGKETNREQHLKDTDFKDTESKKSMIARMDSFLNHHFYPVLRRSLSIKETTIAVVSHGIILSTLWRCLLSRFEAKSVKLGLGLSVGNGGYTTLEHLGSWSNTGYLELDIHNTTLANTIDTTEAIHSNSVTNTPIATKNMPPIFYGWKMTIKTINGNEHLKGLKRTGGGVGSSKYDEGQRKIETFFVSKKAKLG